MGGIKGIKELLPDFEATDNTFWRWKSQLELLRETYWLGENATRILIGSRLKGRALSWFYSKTEHLTLSIEDLLKEMQQMFDLRPGKLALRKKFEARVWKGDEPFCNYYHEKMILANRVPVAKDELLDYLIEGIINVNLRNQIRFAKFKSRAELLEAFESVSLERGDWRTELGGAAAAEWNRGGVGAVGGGASSTEVRRAEDRTDGAETAARDREVRQVRCYQCGELGHIASQCGRRACYACVLPGHQAVACPGRGRSAAATPAGTTQIVELTAGRPVALPGLYMVGVNISARGRRDLDRVGDAVIDSGSPISLIKGNHVPCDLRSPLEENESQFCGINGSRLRVDGVFHGSVTIQNVCIKIKFYIGRYYGLQRSSW